MEEIFHGSIWCTLVPCWRGTTACCGQPMEQRAVRRRIPVMESIRRDGLQLPLRFKPHDDHKNKRLIWLSTCQRKTLRSHGRCTQLFWRKASGPSGDFGWAPCEISNGSMFPHLGDTWHQGLPVSPQWEGELELGSDENTEDVSEYENVSDEDWNYEVLDFVATGWARDDTSEERESAHHGPRFVTAPLRPMCWSCVPLCPNAYNEKLCGEFAELWFFFMKRKGGDSSNFFLTRRIRRKNQ